MSGPSFFQDTGGASVEGRIPLTKTVYFTEEVDNGDSGSGTKTLDLTVGNKQKLTLTGSPTLAFTAPAGATSIILRFVHFDGSVHTVTWPSEVKWPEGSAPTLSTGAGKIDIVALYFDGTNYYGSASLNFA